MSELATLARPYAAAVFKRAKETKSVGPWSENLAFLSVVFSDTNMRTLIVNPKINKAKLLDFIKGLYPEPLDQEAENFLRLLVQNNRLLLLPTITQLFEEYKSQDEGTLAVEIASAYAFSKEEEKKFSAALAKTLGKKIHMTVVVDQSLIGGVLVKAGDQVIDRSVRGQLRNMQKALH